MLFKDYSPRKIANKLKQVKAFEKKYGANSYTRAWIKWCNNIEYRKNEWQWRQNIAELIKNQ